MKLLYCPSCMSVFNLNFHTKSCECGRVKGKYDANGTTAVVNGEGYSLAMGNGSLENAIFHVIKSEHAGTSLDDFRQTGDVWRKHDTSIIAWARPHSGPANSHTRIDPDLI